MKYFQIRSKTKTPLYLRKKGLYPAPESNRHSFLSVFETDASTSSASWAFVVDLFYKRVANLLIDSRIRNKYFFL